MTVFAMSHGKNPIRLHRARSADWSFGASGTSLGATQHQLILLMEEILHQLIVSLSHYSHGFIHPRWCRISSINSWDDIGMLIAKKNY